MVHVPRRAVVVAQPAIAARRNPGPCLGPDMSTRCPCRCPEPPEPFACMVKLLRLHRRSAGRRIDQVANVRIDRRVLHRPIVVRWLVAQPPLHQPDVHAGSADSPAPSAAIGSRSRTWSTGCRPAAARSTCIGCWPTRRFSPVTIADPRVQEVTVVEIPRPHRCRGSRPPPRRTAACRLTPQRSRAGRRRSSRFRPWASAKAPDDAAPSRRAS